MEPPNIAVLEKIESFQKEMPVELYVKYIPANKLTKPSNQMILLFFKCINEEKYAEGRKKAIAETWAYQGEGAKRVVDFIVKKQEELSNVIDE
jgi:hypothetical protein